MFIRKIRSRNSVCFQIGSKRFGKFVLTSHVGCAPVAASARVEALALKAKQQLAGILFKDQLPLFDWSEQFPRAKLLSWQITGFHLVFGRVYDAIGFPQNLLRDLAIARIVYPRSKLATVRYLNRYLGIELTKDRVYRCLDRLDKRQLTQTAFKFVSQRQRGVSLIFYDVTSLHFETETEDEIRTKGHSKNRRSDLPQILIGLFVDQDGYPFDFDMFSGRTFEGHTLTAAIDRLTGKYQFTNLTVVADAAMLSRDNLNFLDAKQLNYIVGARLKSLPEELTAEILGHDFTRTAVYQTAAEGRKLVVDFSVKRAHKDRVNRERLINRLKISLEKKRQLIRKSKYLKLSQPGQPAGIDWQKIAADEKFDGLKGYLVNPQNPLSVDNIIIQYHNLWKVEKAFRMQKSDLRERPVYHRRLKRIESHLLLCFTSLLVMKETEEILRRKNFSLEKAIEILGKVGQGEIRIGHTRLELDSELDQEVRTILNLFKGY